MITQQDALNSLKKFKAEASSKYGIVSLGIFGSVARNEASEGSDLDVVVETERVNPFQLVHLKSELEQLLGVRVDLIRQREWMNEFLRKQIKRDAIYV
jgi:predicted nucleotidyltransferase